jgi:hypothetical protein
VPDLETVRWRKYQVIIDPWGMVDKVAVAEAEAILVLPGVGQEG